jgi:hypothetical protein
MTPQEIFDVVSEHLFNQGKRSVDKFHCRYRNDDGLRCAVGVLIPDTYYLPEYDIGNQTIKSLLSVHSTQFPDWMHDNVELLSHLQTVHDRGHNWNNSNNMIKALTEVAEYYNLSPLKLENFKKDFEVKDEEN